VEASTVGEAAQLEIGKLPELARAFHVVVNGTRIELPRTASVNGQMENEFYKIREDDRIEVKNSYTVSEIAEFMDVPLGGKIMVNETPAKPGTSVYEGFTLNWDVNAPLTYADLEDEVEDETDVNANVEAEGVSYRKDQASEDVKAWRQSSQGGKAAGKDLPRAAKGSGAAGNEDDAAKAKNQGINVVANGHPVLMTGKDSYVYVDIFSFIDFDLKASGGRAIVTNLNGRNAEYMEPLNNGDVIDIFWKES
jgi:hypothetical protein